MSASAESLAVSSVAPDPGWGAVLAVRDAGSTVMFPEVSSLRSIGCVGGGVA